MIDSFQVLVPSSVRVGDVFEVRVIALDVGGAPVTTDNTTVVALTSADPDLVFDGDEDGTFSVGDNQKTLANGEATFQVRDDKPDRFTLFADDSPQGPITITGSVEVLYGFNALPVLQLESTPPDTAMLDHPRFFAPRDTVTLEEEAEATPGGSPDSNGDELRDELPVTLLP